MSAGTLIRDASADPPRMAARGDWTLPHHAALPHDPVPDDASVDLSGLGELDTAGATRLARLLGTGRLRARLQDGGDLPPARRALLATVCDAVDRADEAVPTPAGSPLAEWLAHVGRAMDAFWQHVVALLGFAGLVIAALLRSLPRPWRWRYTALVAQLERTGLDALPIVALLTFLVGAVVAFLGATVLSEFGASIYTVNLVGFSFLREFAVLLTAILLAGRTASSFTAQIGSMQANEEIDALRAQGLDPIDMLVLPRVLAMLIALPLLTFIAMMSGIAGGALVCALSLDISPAMFFYTLRDALDIRHFLVGMGKAPVFAFLIAIIGCLEGFKVTGSAESVGERTTSSVVQSIFVVILLDAVAAMFFMEMGW